MHDDVSGRPGSPAARTTPRKAAASGWIGTGMEYYDNYIYGTGRRPGLPEVFFPGRPWGERSGRSSRRSGSGSSPARSAGWCSVTSGTGSAARRSSSAILVLMGTCTFLIGCLPSYARIGVVGARCC